MISISSLAWGHPTNFSIWSGDIQYSKLYNLAEILLNFKSAKIYFLVPKFILNIILALKFILNIILVNFGTFEI